MSRFVYIKTQFKLLKGLQSLPISYITPLWFVWYMWSLTLTKPRCPHIQCTSFVYTVPSLPPQNVSSYNTSSTSLHVSWHEVPHGFVHGILLGYRVLYKVAGGTNNNSVASTSGSIREKELQGLKKFTIYEITVLAFTRIGDGANSTSIFVSTDEDSKSKLISLCL